MTDLVPFVVAVLALLAVPGPTNTLMAAAGASRGLVGSLPLLAGELGGYGIAITVWTEIVGAAATSQPLVPVAAKFVAAAFLVWSAWKLWSHAGRTDLPQRGITLSRVFATTLINPKGLVFAFGIFPPVGFVARLPYLGVFAVLVVATAIGWMSLGAMAARSSRGWLTSARVERATALVLVVFAAVLVVQTVQSLHCAPDLVVRGSQELAPHHEVSGNLRVALMVRRFAQQSLEPRGRGPISRKKSAPALAHRGR